jgi:ssDNA-binding Zn-finger/Zn-ribbon topoisomerase 1
MRECTKCHETKPLTEFYKRKQSKDDGVQRKCKECVNAAYKVYWQKNKFIICSKKMIKRNPEKYYTFTI